MVQEGFDSPPSPRPAGGIVSSTPFERKTLKVNKERRSRRKPLARDNFHAEKDFDKTAFQLLSP